MNVFKDMKRNIKWVFQRLFRGFDDRDYWSLNDTISKFALPRLILLKKKKHGYPWNFKNMKEWNKTLDEIIWAHKFVINEQYDTFNKDKYDRCQKGLELFGKHYRSLWD